MLKKLLDKFEEEKLLNKIEAKHSKFCTYFRLSPFCPVL